MSRIAKKGVLIPSQVKTLREGRRMNITGPLGTVSREFRGEIAITVEGDHITFAPSVRSLFTRALLGTYASHVRNMIKGVMEGYTKRLIIEGTGYRASVQGNKLVLNIGFSHPVEVYIPEGVKVVVEKNTIITISGIDKELVSGFAAEVRLNKKPEPYKGKGIRYEGETILRKEGKKSTA